MFNEQGIHLFRLIKSYVSPDLLRKKKKTTRALTLVVCTGARCSSCVHSPRAVQARYEHPHRPTPCSSLSISTSGAWVQSGPPARIQTVGRGWWVSLKHCGDYARLGRHILVGSVFCKALSAVTSGHRKNQNTAEEVPGLWRPFQQRDAAMKFTCTLTRGGGARVRQLIAVADHFTVH